MQEDSFDYERVKQGPPEGGDIMGRSWNWPLIIGVGILAVIVVVGVFSILGTIANPSAYTVISNCDALDLTGDNVPDFLVCRTAGGEGQAWSLVPFSGVSP